MELTAAITKNGAGYELRIGYGPRQSSAEGRPAMILQVPGKRQARKLALEVSAKPWNF